MRSEFSPLEIREEADATSLELGYRLDRTLWVPASGAPFRAVVSRVEIPERADDTTQELSYWLGRTLWVAQFVAPFAKGAGFR